jgi:hypothetical protein
MKKLTIIVVAMICIASGSTRVYEIEPYKNCNGLAAGDQYHGIGQIFIAICDSFLWVDMFIGAKSRNPGYNYHAEILEYPNGAIPIYSGDTVAIAEYRYTRIPLSRQANQKVLKGKQYLLRITHSNGDSINYYYDSLNTYKYGYIVVGGIAEPGSKDLAARIEA